jgi:hypothetical protein
MDMKKFLVIPDLHGRDFFLPALNYEGDVIFLGDYCDPYPAERISFARAFDNFKKIIAFKKANPGRVTLILGNHDFGYLSRKGRYGNCRRDEAFAGSMYDILTTERDLFQLAKQVGNVLFTHAGVSAGWYEAHREELVLHGEQLADQVNGLFEANKNAFNEASAFRGGWNLYGSPLWTDIREFGDKETLISQTQIVGHTRLNSEKELVVNNVICMDISKMFTVEIDDEKNDLSFHAVNPEV